MPEIGIVQQVDIDKELQDAYLDYAMSVIVSRALPDVRDGLKPVHRRILYAMYDMGLRPDRVYKKSARIVGEVLGKYHPHGDSAVYDAMVRMAQDFSMRYELVEGQGNYGSVDGDSAAAMRYTEARLAAPAMELLQDIEKDTVDFSANFDGTLREPDVMPAVLPNLLVNGADGIAVGMSTKIPPHNVGEVVDALLYLVERWGEREGVTVEDLMRFVKGPDFPTGGLVYRYRDDRKHDMTDTILNAYATGRGRIVVQAKTHVEEMSRNRRRIVVTELPFQTNKSNLIEKIADLAREGKVEGLTDLRDESDRRGMRVVIELTRNVKPTEVLDKLFKYTPLRQTFGVIMLALVDGQPRMLSLKKVLQYFVEHRIEVIRRRSAYELERARDRAHILEGLQIALDHLDKVIDTIRRSRRVDTARSNLQRTFNLSEKQAQAVLDMRLARLAAMERKKVEEELKTVRATILYLEGLLEDQAQVLGVVQEELRTIRERYNDPRRSTIITEAEYTGSVVQAEQLVPDGDVLVTVTQKGEIQRIMNVAGKPRSGRGYRHLITANNRNELLVLSTRGRVWRLPVYQLPEKTGRSNGERLAQLLAGWDRGEEAAALLDVPVEEEALEEGYLLAVTRRGRVVRVSSSEVKNLHSGTSLVNVEQGDELIWAGLSRGEDTLLLASMQGQAIQFKEADVRPTGLGVQGVWGIKLETKEDAVVGAALARQGDQVVVMSERGHYKRTALAEYPIQGRYGKGVRAMNLDESTGKLAVATVARVGDRLSFHSSRNRAFNTSVRHVPAGSRYHQGEPVAEMPANESIAGLMLWLDRSAWPESGSGIKSASPEEAGTDKMGATSGKPSTRSMAKRGRSKPRNRTAEVEPDGEQLALNLDGSASGSGANGRTKRKSTRRKGRTQ